MCEKNNDGYCEKIILVDLDEIQGSVNCAQTVRKENWRINLFDPKFLLDLKYLSNPNFLSGPTSIWGLVAQTGAR